MRAFAEHFYQSKSWERVRSSIIAEHHGLCVICGRPAQIVHHILWLSPENINKPEITLARNFLLPVCQLCHNQIHQLALTTAQGLKFNEQGELVQTESDSRIAAIAELGKTYDGNWGKIENILRGDE